MRYDVYMDPKVASNKLRKTYYGIGLMYVLYPLFYQYSFYGRDDYALINSYDSLVNVLLTVVVLLAAIAGFQAIKLKRAGLIGTKKLVLCIVASILLSVLFIPFAFLISLLDFVY